MSAAPTAGTATFLFSDIEGSSALWERAPDAMRGALADHDAIVRDAVAGHRGVVFKTMGDAFCCVFTSPEDAVEAAVGAQRALRGHAWPEELGELRVRMGIHCGKAAERDGDYFGPTINRVARLMAIGSGGQILASASAAELLRETLPGGMALLALGAHRLRDLSQSESVYQVVVPGLRLNFPALASLDARPNNLPSQFSSFVGREHQIRELRTILAGHRLVTLAGAGGIGKTRLALQVAAGAIEQFRDGAWFIELASIGDPELVAQAIVVELGIGERRFGSIEETLLRHLSRKRLLLVVDNAEHLLAGVASVVRAILSRCPDVVVLVTSREPLHLTGEQVYRLAPMPEAPLPAGADDLARHDSTRLFLERARAVLPGLAVDDEEAREIARVCRKLEGIPLAIELAAARVSTLSVRQLDERLSEKLALLTSRDSTLDRHRTLRATIEWSYRLLSDAEKRTFAKLSIFSGGFTLEAFERVVASSETPSVEALESLVEKSFVQLDPFAAEPRYRCLDVMCEFAARELEADGEAAGTAERHARYYAEFASRGRAAVGDAPTDWYERIDDEQHNLRVALEWCAIADLELGGKMALDLAPYWRVRGTITEARTRVASLVAGEVVTSELSAALLSAAASFATMQDDFDESLRLSAAALAIYRKVGDESGVGEALFRIAEVEHRRGRLEEAQQLYGEARGLLSRKANARVEMLCVANLGMIARQRGDHETAKRLLEDALVRARSSGERRIAGEFAIATGWVNLYLGDVPLSRLTFEEALREKESQRDRYGVCAARGGLATAALKGGRLAEAFDQFVEMIDEALDLGLHGYVFRGFHGVAAALALEGRLDEAARYLGLAERIFRESGRELRDSIAYDLASEALDDLPAPRRAALLAEGAQSSPQEAMVTLRRATTSFRASGPTGAA